MVRNYKRKKERTYTIEKLQQAIQDVKIKRMTSYQAAKLYNIPRSTIMTRIYRTYAKNDFELSQRTRMVRNYKRTTNRGSWPKEAMYQAVLAVLEKRMGYSKAAKTFSVPRTTLERRVKIARTSCTNTPEDIKQSPTIIPLGNQPFSSTSRDPEEENSPTTTPVDSDSEEAAMPNNDETTSILNTTTTNADPVTPTTSRNIEDPLEGCSDWFDQDDGETTSQQPKTPQPEPVRGRTDFESVSPAQSASPLVTRKTERIKIQNRWQNLRTCFKKEYNLQKGLRLSVAAKKRKKYEFYDQLQFLIPTINEKSTSSTIKDIIEEEVLKTPETATIVDPPFIFASTDPNDFTPQSSQTTNNKNKAKDITNNEQFKKLVEKEIDEDELFLLSLVPSLRRMNNSQKLRVKMKFLQTISDVEEETQMAMPPCRSCPQNVAGDQVNHSQLSHNSGSPQTLGTTSDNSEAQRNSSVLQGTTGQSHQTAEYGNQSSVTSVQDTSNVIYLAQLLPHESQDNVKLELLEEY